MSNRNRQKRGHTIPADDLRRANVAWNAQADPVLAVRRSAAFVMWCGEQQLTPTKKRAAKFMRVRGAEVAPGGGQIRSFGEMMKRAGAPTS